MATGVDRSRFRRRRRRSRPAPNMGRVPDARGLRISFVSFHTSPVDRPGSGDVGGMNVMELHQAGALADLGHQVDLITRRASPAAPDALPIRPGVTLRHVTAGPRTPLPKSAQDAHIEEFRANFDTLGNQLSQVLSGGGAPPYDVVHSHHWMSGVSALPLARAWGIPHVQSFHSVAALPGGPLHEGEPPESPARVSGEAQCAQESDLVVTISAHEARTVVERCGADPDRVTIVPPGVDGKLFRPLRAGEDRMSWGNGRPAAQRVGPNGYVFFAARLQPLKGADLAISAVASLPAQDRPHLIVAGEGSADFADYQAELLRLVEDEGMADDVTFLGPQDRDVLAAMLRGARVVLVPSHSETFGLIALEASASGTPVLAMAAGGLREAVVDGESGLLMWTRDPGEWGAALQRLLRSNVHLRAGQVGRIHSRRFVWADVAYRLVRIYARLIVNGRRP